MQEIQSFCVSIPDDLLCYKKVSQIQENETSPIRINSQIEFEQNNCGQIECSKFYDSEGDLVKALYYNGTFVVKKCRYKNNKLNAVEEYDEHHILSKIYYDSYGEIESRLEYKYNRNGKTTSITKYKNDSEYSINYGYDDIQRVNTREIIVNGTIAEFQRFRYDILDRIVEYQDKNQKINISQYSEKNELIYYTITDKIGNIISVINYFDSLGKYIKTDICLNDHNMTIKDISYVDNIMLKKPYTTEDDIDLIISNLFGVKEYKSTKRHNNSDIVLDKIELSIKATTLPISIRKRLLYNIVVNS